MSKNEERHFRWRHVQDEKGRKDKFLKFHSSTKSIRAFLRKIQIKLGTYLLIRILHVAFKLIAVRHENKSTISTTQSILINGLKFFVGFVIANTILDRLKINGFSYHMKDLNSCEKGV